jgi:hypothetical protein
MGAACRKAEDSDDIREVQEVVRLESVLPPVTPRPAGQAWQDCSQSEDCHQEVALDTKLRCVDKQWDPNNRQGMRIRTLPPILDELDR